LTVDRDPAPSWEELRRVAYKGAIWVVQRDAMSPEAKQQAAGDYPGGSQRRVLIPPKCPQCEAELEESRRLFRGYAWRCGGCGFRTESKDSFTETKAQVERLQRRLREELGL